VPTVFEWLANFIEILFIWVPRRFQIKTTHGAVKFVKAKAVALGPGCHWYWPWTSTYTEIATAEQTHNLPTQAIELPGAKKPLAVSGVIVYSVRDVLAALSRSFEVDDTINDVGLAAVMEVVGAKKKTDLLKERQDGTLQKALTVVTRRRLKKYGIHVERCSLTDFTSCMPILNMGEGGQAVPVPAEEDE
jgi:regulator of protease activity HflC (stomatin/prohibitin superfamily)